MAKKYTKQEIEEIKEHIPSEVYIQRYIQAAEDGESYLTLVEDKEDTVHDLDESGIYKAGQVVGVYKLVRIVSITKETKTIEKKIC